MEVSPQKKKAFLTAIIGVVSVVGIDTLFVIFNPFVSQYVTESVMSSPKITMKVDSMIISHIDKAYDQKKGSLSAKLSDDFNCKRENVNKIIYNGISNANALKDTLDKYRPLFKWIEKSTIVGPRLLPDGKKIYICKHRRVIDRFYYDESTRITYFMNCNNEWQVE